MSAIEKIREGLKERHMTTTRSIGRVFRNMDSYDGNRKIDKEEFKYGLQDYGIQLSSEELNTVMKEFDRDGDGTIDINEFLREIRGDMNEARTEIVKKAFAIMDKDGSGELTLEDLKGRYSVEGNPQIESGEKTEEDVLREFLGNFERNPNGVVTMEDWIDYYADISAGIDNDEYFELMMKRAWKMEE